MKANRIVKFVIVAAFVACWQSGVTAVPLFEEHFDTDTANVPVTYPQYTLISDGTADVSGQQLRLFASGDLGSPNHALVTTQSFGADNDIHVELKLSGSLAGNHAVGLFLGVTTPTTTTLAGTDNVVEIFPGYSPTVRVLGAGGFGLTSAGFTPGYGNMHALDIHDDGAGNFTLKLTEGTSPSSFVPGANTFSIGWSNPNLIPSYRIGFFLEGGTAGGTATFDNLVVIPEPGAASLLSLCALLCWRRR